MSSTEDSHHVSLSSTEDASTARTQAKVPFSQRCILSILQGFTEDSLEIRLPDGSSLRVGGTTCEEQPARIDFIREQAFRRMLFAGEIGFGEAYVEGDWQTDDIARVIRFFLRNVENNPGVSGSRQRRFLFNLLSLGNRFQHWLRRNTRRQSQVNISKHYDLSNNFYSLWLDATWTYSSAYFADANQPLPEAQENKYRRLADSLGLKPGQHVLEIGCGWGGCALYLARHYGVRVTGITISREQYALARQRVAEADLEDQIEILFTDYRDVQGSFDAIISVEMIEAVGHSFLKPFFEQCHHLLKRSGRLALQAILAPDARYDKMRRESDWIKKYIFPGGQLPSLAAINAAINRTGELNLLSFDSFGQHYAKTLALWRQLFNAQIEEVKKLGFDEQFIRKWNYYLSYCEGAFSTSHINVAHIVYGFPNTEAALT